MQYIVLFSYEYSILSSTFNFRLALHTCPQHPLLGYPHPRVLVLWSLVCIYAHATMCPYPIIRYPHPLPRVSSGVPPFFLVQPHRRHGLGAMAFSPAGNRSQGSGVRNRWSGVLLHYTASPCYQSSAKFLLSTLGDGRCSFCSSA